MILLSTEYIDCHQKLEVACSQGHKFSSTPSGLRKYGCKKCSYQKQLHTLEYIVKTLQERGSDIKPLPDQIYEGSRYPLQWICGHGHIWQTSWNKIEQGSKCPTCSKRLPWSSSRIQGELLQDGRGISWIGGEAGNHYSRLIFQCPQGHTWEAACGNVLQLKQGCPYCAGNAPLTLEIVRERAIQYELILLSQSYINAVEPLSFQCLKGHQFPSSWRNIQQGKGCPYCINKTEGRIGDILRSLLPHCTITPQYRLVCPTQVRKSTRVYLDYYVPELKLGIEYHGYQHYEFPNHCHRTKAKFEAQQLRDQWVREYCVTNSIAYMEIPYWEEDPETLLTSYIRGLEVVCSSNLLP